jgi:hypothetical protein
VSRTAASSAPSRRSATTGSPSNGVRSTGASRLTDRPAPAEKTAGLTDGDDGACLMRQHPHGQSGTNACGCLVSGSEDGMDGVSAAVNRLELVEVERCGHW